MRQLVWTAAFAMAIAGCKKEKSDDGEAAPERDGSAMWKLAPEGTRAGLVVAPGAGTDLHEGFIEVATSLQKHPMGARALAEVMKEAASIGIDPLKPDGFSAVGIDPSRGVAIFFLDEEDGYGILPVTNRVAFLEATGGKEENGVNQIESDMFCAQSGDHYRCAGSPEKLAAWKPAAKPVDAGWPAELRGSIEYFVDGGLLAEVELFTATMAQTERFLGAVRIERGGALARFSFAGKPNQRFQLGKTPLADKAKQRDLGALLVGYGRILIDQARSEMRPSALNDQGPGGVTPGKLLDALTGEVVAYAPAGAPSRGFIEIGISDSAPFKALASLCAMAPPLGPGIEVRSTNNGCAAKIGPPQFPTATEIAVAVEDSAIVATIGDQSAGRDGKGGVLPGYIKKHPWLGAMWMRGSILGGAEQIPAPQLKQMLAQAPEAALGLWAFAHVSELGAGFRSDDEGIHGFARVSTTWRNPDPVVAELEPLLQKFAAGDLSSVAGIKALANKHGKSPLAKDIALGSSGGAVGAAAIGVMAAVAIPAFIKYTRKAKTSEARMFTRKMHDGALAHALDPGTGTGMTPAEASVPSKSTPITPPLGTCCAQGGKCAPDPALWTHETWVRLQFSIDDPHYYSYQYEVAPDGKSFTARALGDLDCDGVYSTFEVYGGPATRGAGLSSQNETE